ncbi:MAG: VOC family protein [Burkholderiaceae bacterium]
MQYLPGKFVWFEHVSADPAKAAAFYGELCGWSRQSMPMDQQTYDIIMNGDKGIGGYRKAEPGQQSHWASYLSVPDVDKSFAAASKAGAQSLLPPTDFGAVGRAAAISDPTGAMVFLWKGAQEDPADVEKTPHGGWFWNELHSTDAKAAAGFYAKLIGYQIDTMDMGPAGPYYILKDDSGKMRAGVLQQEPGMPVPSHWLPYIHVADCDAAQRKAMTLGANKTVVPPTDIPNIGRFAIMADPLGALIGVITSAG